jgi:hypothetical protein
MVSFNMDYYWRHKQSREAYDVSAAMSMTLCLRQSAWRILTAQKDERMGGPVSDKDRIQKPAFFEDYNYTNFLAYVLYTPLYLWAHYHI